MHSAPAKVSAVLVPDHRTFYGLCATQLYIHTRPPFLLGDAGEVCLGGTTGLMLNAPVPAQARPCRTTGHQSKSLTPAFSYRRRFFKAFGGKGRIYPYQKFNKDHEISFFGIEWKQMQTL